MYRLCIVLVLFGYGALGKGGYLIFNFRMDILSLPNMRDQVLNMSFLSGKRLNQAHLVLPRQNLKRIYRI